MHARKKRGEDKGVTGQRRLSATIRASLASKTKIILFGGKGGVGKTTVAAAFAILLTSASEKVLIVSSDPAPSLSDIFETRIGGTIAEPVKGLQAIEIDAQQAVEKYKVRYGGILVDILSTIVPVGKEILDDIPDDVAPGFDELFALEEVLSYMGRDYDFIVWDTAPTGHTLRLLSLPDTIGNYATGMLAIHRRVEGVLSTIRTLFEKETIKDTIIETISELRDTSWYTRQILTDPGRSEFIPVIIPEALALYQTVRLEQTLDELGIPIHRMVVNGIVPENSCPFCSARRSMQMKYLRAIRKQFENKLAVIEMPLFSGEIKGLDHVLQYADLLAKQPGFSGIGAEVGRHG
ncbi:MAG: TRC40/GET3/ArsA family transport-energizing ATPase [Methanoregulaceae archaeon]